MSAQAEVDWDAVASLRASTTRKIIVESLSSGPKYAAEVAKIIGTTQGTVSNHYRWLKQHDPPLIECLTPDRPHHRLYRLTPEGELALDRA